MKTKIFLAVILITFLNGTSQAYAQLDGEPQMTKPPTLSKEQQAAIDKNALQQRDNLERIAKEKQKLKEADLKMKALRETFKEKLQNIKDERKKAIVERVDTKFVTINKNRTTQMTKALDKLDEIFSKLTTKVAEAKKAGKDTTEADAAITSAASAITAARTAVTAQANKEYTPAITDETTLKQTVGSTMSQLQKDLQTTHEKVQTAKQAVMKVAQIVAHLNSTTNQ